MNISEEFETLRTEVISVEEVESPSTFGESSLRESLCNSQIDNMLESLSKKKDLRVKNQQRGEPDLSSEEKLDILKTIFAASPMSFLNRFGKHLDKVHLDCFAEIPGVGRDKDKDIKLYVDALDKAMSTVSDSVRAKNRRYEALQKLVDTTDYFTEPEMQRRNPILFEQLIGKYHSQDERAAFLQLCESCGSAKDRTPLSDMLIAHMVRPEDGQFSERRQEQEHQLEEEEAANQEYLKDTEEDMEEDEYDYSSSGASKPKDQEEEECEEIDEDEKDLLKEEFFTTMYMHFLEGKDEDFDYTTVDNNEEYDCGETMNQDEEDKYFDADESETTCASDNNANGGDREMTSSPELNPSGTHNEEDSEDELDAYMKTIEKQLQSKK